MASLGDSAEAAGSRAPVAQNHEGRRASAEALVNVRTARGLANRVQFQPSQFPFDFMQRHESRFRLAQPCWQARSHGQYFRT